MSTCDSDCICCCLPCVVCWACIYMTYAGVRKVGRFAYKKCHPEPESSTSAQNRRIDEHDNRETLSQSSTMRELNSHPKHRSRDMASSITQVQEPEKAYSTDLSFTVRTTQPAPIDPMNLPPDFVPKPIFKAPAHLPSPTLSNYESRSSRRQSDTAPHMIKMNDGKDGAIPNQPRSIESVNDQRPPR
ncbi:hypothetical protein FA13DRAFT_1725662 [Coprinellus micaceus]|uniref:Uncharacterized protein n=1 Tax=Coprinellus micaceus TaxID=71717 RepID=A0A4Y7TVM9_COPMI|nr:hypothetical protein FA13DRAFT_1725662 [Coprinellus micaceus]